MNRLSSRLTDHLPDLAGTANHTTGPQPSYTRGDRAPPGMSDPGAEQPRRSAASRSPLLKLMQDSSR